jgi:hypothetical protein
MIHYQLRCGSAHGFDGWFRDSAAFEKQAAMGLIECPECGGTDVERALMAPAVARRGAGAARGPELEAAKEGEVLPPAGPAAQPGKVAAQVAAQVAAGRLPAQVLSALQKIRAEVEKSCDYVGPSFADEARKMHRGESEHRAIYGETTPDQAESLAEEGIEVAKIPWVPRADG